MDIRTLIQASRAKFIILTPMCLLLSYSLATVEHSHINPLNTVLIVIGALCAHISVNLFNEYQDFHSGLDFKTNKTPFSGGSGALVANPNANKQVLVTALITLAIVILIGLYFTLFNSWLVLPFGSIGVILILTYTQYINRIPLLCLLAPGFGFGSLMVLLSLWIMTGHISYQAICLSFVPFFQINNLLLLNQFPDLEADRAVGRNHALIAYGLPSCQLIYTIFMLLPYIMITVLVINDSLPLLCLITLFTLPLGITVAKALYRLGTKISEQLEYLALNVLITVVSPLLLSLALLLA